ncbi:11301_t:CDS:2 [Rhizophagus irregularis]|nr:11301_t:CDS:2 [Rhizophagus irregularis]
MSYRVSTQNRAKRRTKHSYIHRKFHQHNQRDKINQDTRTKTPPKKHRIIHAPPIIRTTKNISWIQPNQKYRPQLNNSQQQIKDTPLPSHASHHVAHQDKTQLLLKKNWQINIKEIKGLNDIIESINRIRKERIPQEKATRIKYDAKSG